MSSVTVSSKYQIVIPKEARASGWIKPGQKLEVLSFPGSLALVRSLTLKELRGIAKGITTDGYRDKKDRTF